MARENRFPLSANDPHNCRPDPAVAGEGSHTVKIRNPNLEFPNKHESTKHEIQDRRFSVEHLTIRLRERSGHYSAIAAVR